MNPEALLRKHIRSAPAYTPILPFDVLSEQLGVPAGRIVKLDANENPYGLPDGVRTALCELEYGHIYPDPESRRLRSALAEAHGVPADNLLAGAGADELIDLVMRLFLEPGDAILNCPPTFGMYAFDAGLNAARCVDVPRRADFSLDVPAIVRTAGETGAKLLFLTSPNNPDGSLLPRDTLLELLELPLVIVLDEAYVEFAPEGTSWLAGPLRHNNLIVLRTFSKWAALAGLRVGYGVFPGWLMPHLWKAKQPYNLSVPAQAGALAALACRNDLETLRKQIISERERMRAALAGISWLQPYPSQANFILCRVVGVDAQQVKIELARRGILIRYFNAPALRDHIRISVGRPGDTDRLLTELRSL